MIVKANESLSKYTSVKIGGTAENFYIPESVNDLCSLLSELKEEKYYVISGGSNLLINDSHSFKHVINLRKFNDHMRNIGDGVFYVGSSSSIQEVIRFINSFGYGGIEYLYSLPARIGGIIYMNAGRGRTVSKSISNYVVSVDVLCGGIIKTLNNSECLFEYRKSVFQKMPNTIILGATFKFEKVDQTEAQRRIKERIDYCKVKQDYSGGSFGSVFNQYNPVIMKYVMKISRFSSKGIHFSSKTINWMVNNNGTFKQAIRAIHIVTLIHKLSFQKCNKEVIIWK